MRKQKCPGSWIDEDYEANWWTQGNEPGTGGEWGPWKNITGDPLDPPVDPPVDPYDPGYNLGETIAVTEQKLTDRWEGINPSYKPDAVAGSIQLLIDEATYEALLPRRYGSPGWSEISGKTDEEYYTYSNLISALTEMSNIKLRIETRAYTTRVFRLNKTKQEETFLREDDDFDASWLVNGPTDVQIVDYGKFVNEGSLDVKKRDLAAFLANISHETTGGWATAPGGPYAFGLYFKEEVGKDDDTVGAYSTGYHPVYPSNPNESYHGRGPIQLSWNYNYGYMSQVIYADKNVLLNDPDRVAHDGKLGYMTGIWFWMTPQLPKPSCHDVMTGNWIPNAEDIAENRLPGFGTTINVINGGLEAGIPNDYRVMDRIGFYGYVQVNTA